MPTTTEPAAAAPYTVTFVKADRRYYVHLDGEKVGWVSKMSYERTWCFYACTRRWAEGNRLSEEATRRDAVMEGLSSLGIYHLGATVRLDDETLDEVVYFFDKARLDATWQALLDEKYPHVAEALGRC